MGRQSAPRGRRVARFATILGISCAIGAAFAVPAMAAPSVIPGTPCTVGTRACVDLVKQKAWLIDPAGKVIRGPVSVATGGLGKETPVGTFKVLSKDKDHKSNEYKTPQGLPAPMPWSVFFAPGGIAFHSGTLNRASAGCVRLTDADAQVFYNTLQIGDQVQVRNDGAPGATSGQPSPSERSEAPKPSTSSRPAPAPAQPSAAPRPTASSGAGGGSNDAAPSPAAQPDQQPGSNGEPTEEKKRPLDVLKRGLE